MSRTGTTLTRRLELGTAQFGMRYGINNREKIPTPEIFDILKMAKDAGVDTLDTAYQYGGSELALGQFLERHDEGFKVISKLPDCTKEDAESFLSASLKRLKIDHIDGLLYHSFSTFEKDPSTFDKLTEFKTRGLTRRIGFSLYHPSELEKILAKNVVFDIAQVPFSVFDRRFEPYLAELAQRRIEVQARSVFLQGLFFSDVASLPAHFEPARSRLAKLEAIKSKYHLSIAALCLNFVAQHKEIGRIIVGVDSERHFRELACVEVIDDFVAPGNELDELRMENESILLPYKWRL